MDLMYALLQDSLLADEKQEKFVRRAPDQHRMLQVGAFPHYGGRWAEWNGKFRDTVRSFIKGSEGPWAKAFASAVCGSPTIYSASQPDEGRRPPVPLASSVSNNARPQRRGFVFA